MPLLSDYDHSKSVKYHYGKFPPDIDPDVRGDVLDKLLKAQESLARYDQALAGLPSRDFFLGPLNRQEAVLSSRMEGTISTVDEILLTESDDEPNKEHRRDQAREVLCYATALTQAQNAVSKGHPINETLIRNTHQMLMRFGRGSEKTAGKYKEKQNYIADNRKKIIEFTPITPQQLAPGMERLMCFLDGEDENIPALVRLAVGHVEFEALHPFDDGNGRIGRLLIPLLLWKYKILKEPYFFISAYLEENKEDYLQYMRRVSSHHDWAGWLKFFLTALMEQADQNLKTIKDIQELHEQFRPQFRESLNSRWVGEAQDFVFSRPIFMNRHLIKETNIPRHTAIRITRELEKSGILTEIIPSSGQRGAIYSFEPLMELIRV